MNLTGQDCINLISMVSKKIESNRELLTQLDSMVGDGDHGVNLDTAMKKAATAVSDLPDPTPTLVMRTVGATLINDMGGASGVIFGSFFRGGSRKIKNETSIDLENFLLFMEGGLAEVQKRGKAQVGDKTCVDVLVPAIEALKTAVSQNPPFQQVLDQMAIAADAGAESTKEMIAQFGRAKFLGERAKGHQDAGATSMALILNTWAEFGRTV